MNKMTHFFWVDRQSAFLYSHTMKKFVYRRGCSGSTQEDMFEKSRPKGGFPCHFSRQGHPWEAPVMEGCLNNRPARQWQLLAQIYDVTDIETTKDLITFTDPYNNLASYNHYL